MSTRNGPEGLGEYQYLHSLIDTQGNHTVATEEPVSPILADEDAADADNAAGVPYPTRISLSGSIQSHRENEEEAGDHGHESSALMGK
jgi:hypothetical protein